MHLNRQADLLEVVHALVPPRRLAHCLDRRQQQCHQNADNRDDDEQLDQGKSASGRFASRANCGDSRLCAARLAAPTNRSATETIISS